MQLSATIKVTVESCVSEAALYEYLEDFLESIERMKYDDHRRWIHTDWDSKERVELDIKATVDKD